jgi:hypothetical protein
MSILLEFPAARRHRVPFTVPERSRTAPVTRSACG